MQPSRRAFLLGRRPPVTAWDELRLRLARVAQGALRDAGPRRAVLAAHDAGDVRQARALCADYGAVLALVGTPLAQTDPDDAAPPVLVVDPASLDRLVRTQSGWHAGPGCRAHDLARSGLPQFADAPPDQMLAVWLAERGAWPVGGTAASGVRDLDLLLADGSAETLGPFGQDDLRPLHTATAQRLVPALFQLAGTADAALCLAAARWPARYRLDALRPREPAQVNLAHLLLGHGGTLAWVEGATLAPPAPVDQSRPQAASVAGAAVPNAPDVPPGDGACGPAARRLDMRVAQAFDPAGLYGAA